MDAAKNLMVSGADSVQMRPSRQFFATLDGIRGIAALIVVGVHVNTFFGMWLFPEGALAVDIFFVLSGVVIANAYEHRLRSGLSASEFIKIRLIRLYPLYALGTVIGILNIQFSFNSERVFGFFPLDIAAATLFLPNMLVFYLFPFDTPAWSLFFEVAVNIAYVIFFRVTSVNAVLATLVAASAIGLVGVLYFGPNHSLLVGWNTKNFGGGFPRVSFSFFAGILLFRLHSARKSILSRDWPMAAFMPWIVIALVALTLGARPSIATRPYYEFTMAVFFFPALVYIALSYEPTGVGARVCEFLGAISYAVYVIHGPLSELLGGIFLKTTGVAPQQFTPWAGFGFFGMLLPICWALNKFYDDPLRRLLRHRLLTREHISLDESSPPAKRICSPTL